MIELGEIVPVGPLAEMNKLNQALGERGDVGTAEVPEITNRVSWGKEPQARD